MLVKYGTGKRLIPQVVHCTRCNKYWSTFQDRPRICPGCNSAYWDVEVGTRYDRVKLEETNKKT